MWLPTGKPARLRSATFDALSAGAQFRDRVALRIDAPPAAIFRALGDVSLLDMKLVWLAGEMRYLPARLLGRMPPAAPHRPFVATLLEGGSLVLHDDRPRELILGSAAQLHRIVDQRAVRFLDRAAFDRFDDPRYEKLFIGIRVAPGDQPEESWAILEHATRAMSADAERRFRRYWRFIRPAGALVSLGLLRAVRAKVR